MTYNEAYDQSINDKESFWREQAKSIDWFKFPEKILSQNEKGFYRWYEGGQLNTSYLALDYHVENGRANQTAIIYDSPVTDTKEHITYQQLLNRVAKFAGVLQNLGVKKGDRVVIYMPMIPQTAVAMLACARIGAVHSVVFGGFAAHELAIRIDDATPKVILTASGGKEINRIVPYKPIIDAAIEEATHKVKSVVVYQRDFVKADMQEGRDFDWKKSLIKASPAGYVALEATDPLYILYTSGTTGKPKGIVRDNGGHAVALKFSMKYVYGMDEGNVYWAASDVGWVVGHSYIVYAPLIHGCTTILFEGKPIRTPDAGTFWRVIEEHKVKALFTAPTAFRAIRKEDPNSLLHAKYDNSSLKYLFLAGERCDVATYEWLKNLAKVPVIDHWWQTESGWAMLANMAGFDLHETKPGSATKPVCGYDIQIVNANNEQLGANEEGAVVVKLPLAPGCLPTLWNNDERFQQSYLDPFPSYYFSGDGGYIDEDGYVFITGRIDDIINVAGHRLSTAEMEEVVASHTDVAECCVVGIADDLKGQIPVGFFVLKAGVEKEGSVIEKELIQMVRNTVGPVAAFKRAAVVQRLPKTRSGKILRKIIRAIADGKKFNPPSTIEDMSVLDEMKAVMQEQSIGQVS
jgi:acetate--CoA ligase